MVQTVPKRVRVCDVAVRWSLMGIKSGSIGEHVYVPLCITLHFRFQFPALPLPLPDFQP